jgi:transcriptional regulator with XRE-family HTH domain
MPNIDFPAWLRDQLDRRSWRVSDLAKRSHKSDAAVSRVLHGERNPDPETLVAFATALNISPILMFRKAGLLPSGPDNEVQFEDWQHLLNQMTPEDEAEMRQIAEMKIERRQREQSLKSLKSKTAK